MYKWFLVALALMFCMIISSSALAEMITPNESFDTKSLNSLSRRIVNSCTNPSMTQYEKAVALYDWLIDHTVYKKGKTNPHYVLRTGQGSCGGYANAYQVLLRQVGINSRVLGGRLYTQAHSWNQVKLNGKWYHVDVRMGDHMALSEGRYRRFGMSNEQAKLYYKFKKDASKSFAGNYAYQSGALDNAIAYVREAINARVAAGESVFVIDLTAKDAPPELADPFNRITVKNSLKQLTFSSSNIPDPVSIALELQSANTKLLVSMKVPTYRIKDLILTTSTNIDVEVSNYDFSAVAPLELGSLVTILPAYATNKTLYWNSSKETVAEVDQNGKVTIKGIGKVKIKVATIDRSKISRIFTLNIIST